MKTEKLSIVEKFGENGYEEYRIPSVIITNKGTVLVAYESREDRGNDWSKVDVTVRRSIDGGYHFEEPMYPWPIGNEEFSGKQTWSNPVLIADGNFIHCYFVKIMKRFGTVKARMTEKALEIYAKLQMYLKSFLMRGMCVRLVQVMEWLQKMGS